MTCVQTYTWYKNAERFVRKVQFNLTFRREKMKFRPMIFFILLVVLKKICTKDRFACATIVKKDLSREFVNSKEYNNNYDYYVDDVENDRSDDRDDADYNDDDIVGNVVNNNNDDETMNNDVEFTNDLSMRNEREYYLLIKNGNVRRHL